MSAPVSIAADELLKDTTQREFILLAGKDGSGKTSALISVAQYVEMFWPNASVFVIDTENKFIPTLKSWGSVPKNLRLYKCESMNDVTAALDEIMHLKSAGDWVLIESAGRIWGHSQDLGYQAIEGTTKAEYLERRRQKKRGEQGGPIPSPDRYWDVVKGAHDTEFLDVLSNCDDLNVVLTTTVAKPKAERSNRKENEDRKALRAEHGIDLNLDGAPRLPYYVLTMALLERLDGAIQCTVLRDNCSKLEDPRVTFAVQSRRTWMDDFWAATEREIA